MTAKLTEPQERCPVCGGKLRNPSNVTFWFCNNNVEVHLFCGPTNDPTGRKVDRMIRAMKRRIVKEPTS